MIKSPTWDLKLILFIFLLAGLVTFTMVYWANQLNSDSRNFLTKFELGFWAIPIFCSNFIFLGIGILHYKKRLPLMFNKLITYVFQFEISKKIAWITIVIILSLYVVVNLNGLQQEESFVDTPASKAFVKGWQLQLSNWIIGANLKYFFLHYSLLIFHNVRIIPFLVSISIVIFTYLLTVSISKKRFAGIVAMVTLLQSTLFFKYASTSTYENSWILFYLVSLYLIRRWYLSVFSYILSLMSKGLTAIFFPMSLFFIIRSDSTKKEKIMALIFYTLIIAYIAISFFTNNTQISTNTVTFHDKEFLTGFSSVESFLKFDGLILILMIPIIVGLFIKSRKGIKQADSIMILIAGILLVSPLLVGFTDMINSDYRMIPLVVFFAIGLGTILSNETEKTASSKKHEIVTYCVFAIALILVILTITQVIFPHFILRQYRVVMTE